MTSVSNQPVVSAQDLIQKRFSTLVSRFAMFALVAMIYSLAASSALAATYNVTSFNDDGGAGELRTLLLSVNNGDTINFTSPGTLTLSNASGYGTLLVSKSITIANTSTGQVTISGGNHVGVMEVIYSGYAAGTVLTGLTISNGNAGISGNGGGIYNMSGALTLNNDTISGNVANIGGGIANSGTLTMTNSTVSGNTATYLGGGIYTDVGATTINNSTISANTSSDTGTGPFGAGVYIDTTGTLTTYNSILSGNTNPSSEDDLDNQGTLSGNGTSLIGLAAGQILLAPLTSLFPGPLAPTPIMPPLPGSPAFRGGIYQTGEPATDQLGGSRPATANAVIDVGAVELQTQEYTLVVNNSLDVVHATPSCVAGGNNCSLRDALAAAAASGNNNLVYPTQIIFDPTVFPTSGSSIEAIDLSSGGGGSGQLLTIASNLSILGPGANRLFLTGDNSVPVMKVNSGVTAAIYGLSVTDGSTQNGGADASGDGAGIYNGGTLTVNSSTIAQNEAVLNTNSQGGGIYNAPTAKLNVYSSTIYGNVARGGAGICNESTLYLTNSTISGNNSSATNSGGGGIISYASLTVTNSTISSNTSANTASSGGGIENTSVFTIANSIVSGNTNGSGEDDIYSPGAYTHSVGNVIGKTSAQMPLAPIGYYGGSTLTTPPVTYSVPLSGPSIGVGVYQLGESTTDQRGAIRPSTVGATIDAGAVQIAGDVPMIGQVTPNYGPLAGGTTVTIQGTGLLSAGNFYFGSMPIYSETVTSDVHITVPSPAATTLGTVDITASNHYGTSSTSSYDTFDYVAPLTLSPTPATTGTLYASLGASYSQNFTVTGGSGNYSLAYSTSIPPGLIVANYGTNVFPLTGTPTTTGTYTFTLTALDNILTTNQLAQIYTMVVGLLPTLGYNVPTLTYGQGELIPVTVIPTSGSTTTPSGTMTYAIDGGTTQILTLASGAVSVPILPTLSAGSHMLSLSYSGDSTYSPVNNTIALTQNPAALSITASDAGKAYGAANPSFTGAVTGTVNGDILTESFATTATSSSPVGTYPIVPSVTGTNVADYTVTPTDGTLTVTQATPTIAWAQPAAIPANTALSATQLDATSPIAGAFTYNPASGSVLAAGSYTLTATFTPTDTTNYVTATTTTTLTVTEGGSNTLTVAAANANKVFGAANPIFTGTVTGAKGTDTFTESFATAATMNSPVGAYAIVPTASGSNLSNYTEVIDNGTLTITQATPVVTWTQPAAIAANTPLSATQLDATSSVAGTFTYNPAAGAVLASGTYTLTTTFTPTDTTDYAAVTATATLTINAGSGNGTLNVTAANATRTYGAVNPTFTGTVSGAKGTDTFTESFSTLATTTSPVGMYVIVPTATGSNLANYTETTTDGILTITQAGSSIMLTTSAAATSANDAVTFTATVAPGTSGIPTGTVIFYDGANPLGLSQLSNGVASLSLSSLAPGAHSITATYSGDANFIASTTTGSAIAETISGFTLTSASATTVTVALGASASYTLAASPTNGAFNNAITFTVAGLPAGATATFNPATVTPGSAATSITLTITAPTTLAKAENSTKGLLAFALLLPLMGLIRGRKKLARCALLVVFAIVSVGVIVNLTGCGGGTASTTTTSPSQDSYAVTVTATSGTISQTSNLTLTVK